MRPISGFINNSSPDLLLLVENKRNDNGAIGAEAQPSKKLYGEKHFAAFVDVLAVVVVVVVTGHDEVTVWSRRTGGWNAMMLLVALVVKQVARAQEATAIICTRESRRICLWLLARGGECTCCGLLHRTIFPWCCKAVGCGRIFFYYFSNLVSNFKLPPFATDTVSVSGTPAGRTVNDLPLPSTYLTIPDSDLS